MLVYESLPEFDKDLAKLSKSFVSLQSDLETFKGKAIELYHLQKIDNQSVFRVPGLKIETQIYKGKKFACKSLPGKGVMSGIRVIYAYFEEENKVVFVEIYYKGNKALPEEQRIKDNFS